MSADLLESLSTWAWRNSLEALPLALVAILFWRMRSLPAAWRWWLPALFFLRLAMPWVPEMGWHPASLAPWTAATVPPPSDGIAVTPLESQAAIPFLPVLWALGCAAVVGWMLVSHWCLRQRIARGAGIASRDLEGHANWAAARMGLSVRPALRVMPGWSTMAVHGWRRPELLLPADLSTRFSVAQIRGMFLHEMAHVRRRDVLWTWLALGLCALHWFNPLAWLALRRFHADRELACDAAALRALDESARHDYGEALLLCLQGPALRTAPALAPFFRRFPELKHRLQNIMKPTAPTLRSRILTALLVPALAVVTFTTARAQRDGDATKPASPESPAAERPLRDGEKPKVEKRDGEGGKEKIRDGDNGKPVARDGDKPREGVRDGERKRNGARDEDGIRKAGPRDGDQPKNGPREGDQPKSGLRDGEGKERGSRDGENKRTGPRDGEERKPGLRDGDAPKTGPREGDRGKADGERPEAR